ncbi:probable palmitoyltransferase ZDHHC24 [Scaptodrosophila lebanonensis]|uniref:Palmitoyltransferase n=1 Tax=Drosophila lebanonensis TaxID=7225 RepID=A0A6J2T599_DROLE|nr:probable palmitoyltransferase ZDHHC24 [Scaptodrosophila lebanonensis]
MILRPLNRVLPRRVSDLACFLLVAIFVPVTYIFQTTIVLPELHDVGGFWYSAIWVAGLFLVFNLTSNMLACMLVDTTIKIVILKPPMEPDLRCRWRMCEECQALVPPRSQHCDVCKICVLKRDHHCLFTCCCIGHYNYRYFFYFLVYMAIGSLYVSINTSIYLWYLHADVYWRLYTLLKLIFPALLLVIDSSWANFYLFVYELNLLAFSMSTLLLLFHWPVIAHGATAKQRRGKDFDLGLRGNLEMVLGKRMFLTWLSPFVRSELPHDGINWMPNAKEN